MTTSTNSILYACAPCSSIKTDPEVELHVVPTVSLAGFVDAHLSQRLIFSHGWIQVWFKIASQFSIQIIVLFIIAGLNNAQMTVMRLANDTGLYLHLSLTLDLL